MALVFAISDTPPPPMGSHTPRAPLEKVPFPGKNVPNAHLSSEDHNNQAYKADQAASVENLSQRTKFPPFDHHTRLLSFSKHLKLMPTLPTLLFPNFDRRDSQNPAHPSNNIGEG